MCHRYESHYEHFKHFSYSLGNEYKDIYSVVYILKYCIKVSVTLIMVESLGCDLVLHLFIFKGTTLSNSPVRWGYYKVWLTSSFKIRIIIESFVHHRKKSQSLRITTLFIMISYTGSKHFPSTRPNFIVHTGYFSRSKPFTIKMISSDMWMP